MFRVCLFCIFVLLGFFCVLNAQQTDPLEPYLDLIQEDPSLAETLQDLLDNPVPINQATRQDWLQIPLLTSSEVDSIFSWKKRNGAFSTIRTLQKILGKAKYKQIRPFVTLRARPAFRVLMVQTNSWKMNASNSSYAGTPLYSFSKFRWSAKKHYAGGAVLQKDPGESAFNDYWNAFFLASFPRIRLLFGSFYLRFGHGLLFSSPFGQVKSSMVRLPFALKGSGAFPYIGSAENFAQTGICLQLTPRPYIKLYLHWAQNLRDARLSSFTDQIIGFNFSGYHRTPSENSGKDALKETVRGVHFESRLLNAITMGLGVSEFRYSPPIAFNRATVTFNDLQKDHYRFTGDRLLNGSAYFQVQKQNAQFSTELVVSNRGSPGISVVGNVAPGPFFFGVRFWNLTRNFQSPYGRVIGQSTAFPQAQRGIFIAAEWNSSSAKMSLYKYFHQDLWRTYSQPMPVLFDEWLLQYQQDFTQDIALECRLRFKRDEEFKKQENRPPLFTVQKSVQVRAQVLKKWSKKLQTKFRIEFSNQKTINEHGLSVFQEMLFTPLKDFFCALRLTFFRTPTYASRIYEYELDLPGTFANYALYGQGFKWYVRLAWKISPHLKLWLKYRYLHFDDKNLLDVDYGHLTQPLQRTIRLQMQFSY